MNEERRKKLEATLNARADGAVRAELQRNFDVGVSGSRVNALRFLFDPRRDVDTECGYPTSISELAYRTMYDRELGRRVVNVYPEETWKRLPKIFEDPDPDKSTPFEDTLDEMEQRHHLLHYMQRVDELSGVGHYGCILWGLDDGKIMDEPVDGYDKWDENTLGMKLQPSLTTGPYNMPTYEVPGAIPPKQAAPAKGNKRTVLFIRVLDESLIKIAAYERNVNHPRYGLPTHYLITLTDINLMDTSSLTPPTDLIQMRVHWSRISHIADNRKTSEVLGTPRQEPVWNRLCDLRKVMGGSGEMFWRGGFPGISLETQPGMENAELDVHRTREMMHDYMNGLQRYLATTGMSAKSLAPQIADPGSSFDVQVKAICITLGVPYRVFMGIEEGVVSGDQATEAWAGRLANRQTRYVTPMLINPVIQRLVDYGVLEPTAKPRGWQVEWPDLMEMSADDKAATAAKRTTAFKDYVQGGVDVLIPPLEYLTTICGLTEKEARAIVKASVDHIGDVQDHNAADGEGEPVPGREPKEPAPEPPPMPFGGGKPGNIPPGKGGTPTGAGKPGQAAQKPAFKAPKTPPTPKTPVVHAALVDNFVRKEDGQWFVYSEEGKKLSKGYGSKAEAAKRLGEIEYFKHAGK